MTTYLISFNDGVMDFPEEELSIVIEVVSRRSLAMGGEDRHRLHFAQAVRAFVPDPPLTV